MTREELIALVQRILDSGATMTDEELDTCISLLQAHVRDPEVSDLIYWPHHRGYLDNLTATEIVDIALSYQAITL